MPPPPLRKTSVTKSGSAGSQDQSRAARNTNPQVNPRSQSRAMIQLFTIVAALAYQVRIKEVFTAHSVSPHASRVGACFEVLDDAIPHLGPFTSIVQTIRDELYNSIYSAHLTSTVGGKIERVPFFNTVRTKEEERVKYDAQTADALSELQQKLKFRDQDLQLLYKRNLAMKQNMADTEATANKLKITISELEEAIAKAEKEKIEMRMSYNQKYDDLQHGIDNLQELEVDQIQTALASSNHVIEKLSVFKSAYDEKSQGSLNNPNMFSEAAGERMKQELVIDSQGMVEYDIYQAQRLDRQFCEILNYQLDDFESSLLQLKKKREILATATTYDKERETSFKVELTELVTGFRKRATELMDEQKVLQAHIKGLKIILTNYASDARHQTIERTADEALRKYSVVVQLSEDNGQTFTTEKSLKYCNKCGERTAICPHRPIHIQLIELPPTATHIKLNHPILRLRTEFDRQLFESTLADGVQDFDSDLIETEDENLQNSKTILRIWKDFYDERGGKKPPINRSFTVEHVHSIIQELYDARWALEEAQENAKEDSPDEPIPCFIDFFYDFMERRYQVKEVALKAIHDLFTALQKYETESATVAIFTRHLSSEDEVLWKYLMISKKLFAEYETMDLISYRHILQVMYPSRSKEVYEQMELELIAFSKNKFSRDMLEEHLMHMLINLIEPNFRFFYRSLRRFDYQEQGSLTYDEFDEALGQILPVAPNKLKRVRFRLAQMDVKENEVPLERLAMIASYIQLRCCYANSWVPQALIAAEFLDLYSALPIDPNSGAVRLDQDNVVDNTQKEVDELMNPTALQTLAVVDDAAIEEEAVKLTRRLEVMSKAMTLSGQERKTSARKKSGRARGEFDAGSDS
ncbi:hypothetical protein BJ742DRAFT_867047, partial [Cladochytrium replicatum]